MADTDEDSIFQTSSYPFTDHNGSPAHAVYIGQRPNPQLPIERPRWSFQVYVTTDLQETTLPEISVRLLEALKKDSLELYPLRLDVYHLKGATHQACMQHYRREKQARQTGGASAQPIIVPTYTASMPNFLLVLEEPLDRGVTTIAFDPPPELRQDPSSEAYVFEDVFTQRRVPVGQGSGECAATDGRLSQDEESGEWEGNLCDVLESLCGSDWFSEWQEEYDETIEGGDAG